MTFKFLQTKLNSLKEEFSDEVVQQDSSNGLMLCDLIRLEKKKLFGYQLKSIRLYFHERLISVSYQFKMSLEKYPDLIDCISIATGFGPTIITKEGKSYIQ